jgi:hypothetical protein
MSDLHPMIWPDKYHLGIVTLDGPHVDNTGKTFFPELGTTTPLRDALNTSYPTDAHITCYALCDKEGNTGDIPLMRKPVLRQIQEQGGNLYLTCIGLDWDTPGHIPLSPEILVDFLNKFLVASEQDERLGAWAAYYTSRHGTRVFYDLEKPVPVQDGEKYIVSIIKEFKRHGLNFDPTCKDWTRRFRLPKVVRDGIPTASEPMFDIQIQDKKLDIKQFKKADLASLIVAEPFTRKANYPTQEECHRLLWSRGAQGKDVMSFFHKKAKSIIRASSRYYDNIFDASVGMCGDTGRNEFFQAMLGQLVPKLLNACDATVEQIFALLYEPLCALEILPGKVDPASHCWNFLNDIYAREHAVWLTKKNEEAEALEAGQNALERMADGMRRWCTADELFSEDNSVVEAFVKGHLFANVSEFFFPMTEDGWYSSLCLQRTQLVPRIRKSFLKDIVPTEKPDVRGDVVSLSPVEIANTHSTVVHEVQMSPLQGCQGRIDDMDGDKPILQLPMYQRNEFLTPQKSDAVDGWLRAFFGKHYARAERWLQYALAFEEGPICALSIKAPAGIGKKMLTEGLAECLVHPYLATGHDMCSRENGALLKTPFLVANEGLPAARDKAPADTFKELTAGDPIRIRELYKPAVSVINPVRIIFTANDHEILHELTKGKEVSPETRRALGERILHFDLDEGAETYLKRIGGRAFTERDGGRWIRGDSGQPSDFIVARHFLHLYKERKPRNLQDRFCVMGNCADVESFKIASRSEGYSMVVRAVVGLVEKRVPKFANMAFISKTGRVYVTLQAVLAYVREIEEQKITEKVLEASLKSIMRSSTPILWNGLMMYEIDVEALLEYAKPWGIPCARIEEASAMNKGQLE